jgi:hypothetical protein
MANERASEALRGSLGPLPHTASIGIEMQGSARFALRHHLPGCTRFAFSRIRPGNLREAILALGEVGIVARHLDPRTGSLLLFHPRGLSVDCGGLPEAPAGMFNAGDHRRPTRR